MQLAAFHALSVASETSATSQGSGPEEVEEATETERPERFAASQLRCFLECRFSVVLGLGSVSLNGA